MSRVRSEEESDARVNGKEEEEEGEAEEEEEESEDELYNRQQFGIYQALPVPEDVGSICLNPEEATTVEEYLQAVRAQAARCPQVVRVEHPSLATGTNTDHGEPSPQQQHGEGAPQAAAAAAGSPARASGGAAAAQNASMAVYVSQLVAAGTMPDCPDWAKPSKRWLRHFVFEFAKLRQSLLELSSRPSQCLLPFEVPEPHDAYGWERLCFEQPKLPRGGQEPQGPEAEHATGHCAAAKGVPAILGPIGAARSNAAGIGAAVVGAAAATPVQKGGKSEPSLLPRALVPLVLRMDQVVVGRLIARHVADLQAASGMELFAAQWIYALGAVLEKPIHADVSANLRALMRKVANLRAGLQGSDDPQVALLNVTAAVVGAYFGQDAELLNLLGPDIEMP